MNGGVTDTKRPAGTTEDLQALYAEVVSGLSEHPRRLPAKLLYDERGAQLFEQITRTDAYYPTRVEMGILERRLAEVRSIVGPGVQIVEFGTGEGRKTGLLLDALERPAGCIPIDISRSQLHAFAGELRRRFPDLEVLPLTADYTRPFTLPRSQAPRDGSVLIFFPGSTIGNFEPPEAEAFLRRARSSVRTASPGRPYLLIGVDLVKPIPVLIEAYDDPEGVTAEFDRNVLRHLNRLFGGDFPVPEFEHRAVWNAEASRIEMHLVSERARTITLAPELPGSERMRLHLDADEPIVTEHSYKYRLEDFEMLCAGAGWRALRIWTDPNGWFGVLLLQATEYEGQATE